MIDDNIFTLLVRGIWIVLAVTTAGGLVIGSPKTAFSILVGGLLAIANYYWLLSIMKRALQLTADKAGSFAVMRYLLRLAILAVILGLLIASGSVNIAGLFLGLSVIVITITIIAVYRLTHKEDRA
jgi:hypothetical protein